MNKKEKKQRGFLCLGLFVLAILLVLTTGCESKDLTNGELEGYTYQETDEVTNYVKITTNNDEVILIELYPDIAPITVANFQKLVSEHFYDGLIFHRVIPDFMIHTGDPLGNGTGGSEKTIKGEFSKNGVENSLSHTKGVVSMARSEDYDSASSQFFICVSDDDTYLDGEYAAFGKVIAGYDAVERISKVKTSNNKPLQNQTMTTVRFVNVEKAQ